MTNISITFRLVPGTELKDVQNASARIKATFAACRVDIQERQPGTVQVKVFRRDPLASPIDVGHFIGKLQENNHSWANIPFGVDSVGVVHRVNLVKAPHILLGGATGAGKSGAAHAILTAAVTSREGASLVLVDPKGGELLSWAPAASAHVSEKDDMVHVLESAVELMDVRYAWMKAHAVRSLWEVPGALKAVGGVVTLFVDEVADLLMVAKKAAGIPLSRLAQKARAAGIQVMAATQSPRSDLFSATNGCETLRSNLNSPIALRCVRSTESDVILGVGKAAEGISSDGFDPELPGLAVGLDGSVFRFPYVTDSDVERIVRELPQGQSLAVLKELATNGY